MSAGQPEAPLICVVEDDLGVAHLEQLGLRRRGYRSLHFASSLEALASPRIAEVDCWLIDQGLSGGQTGLELVGELRRRGVQAPIVMVTGSDDPEVLLVALRAGVRDYVRKGDGFLELLAARVDTLLASVRAERELQRSISRAELEAERRQELEVEISERRRAEERAHVAVARLRALDRRKDEFLAMLGHELRNPLAPIASAVEVMRRMPLDQERVLWAAGIIGRQVDQMRRLVDDLLDVARIMNGRLTLRRAPLDLRIIVALAVERAEPLLRTRQHRLEEHVHPDPLFVDGDLVRLVQIVANLLDNAAKYTPPGGRIGLHLERTGEMAELRIDDDGMGMTPDTIESLFSLFVQGERSGDAEGGLGLGLALVRRLVSLHEGTVTATSAGPGCGSTFTVRLALTDKRPGPAGPEAPPAPGQRRRVLVVDDNTDAADAVAMLLEMWGYAVRKASDGQRALQAVQDFDPDVVLLDIGLPRLDGYGVLHAAQQLPGAERRHWIALTGYGQDSDRERAMAAGFHVHLTKPVAPDVLRQVLLSAAPE